MTPLQTGHLHFTTKTHFTDNLLDMLSLSSSKILIEIVTFVTIVAGLYCTVYDDNCIDIYFSFVF